MREPRIRRRLILKAARRWEEGWVSPAYRQLDPDEKAAAEKIAYAFQTLRQTKLNKKDEPLGCC